MNGYALLTERMRRVGSDPHAGRKLGSWLVAAGFTAVSTTARYECYDPPSLIAEYLARQLSDRADDERAAQSALREWSADPVALWAQCWVIATGKKHDAPATGGPKR